MSVTIKNWRNGEVIATVEDTDDLRQAVIRLTRKGIALISADLRDSDLRDSDLRGSNLSDSDLRDSNLSGSDLRGSDLRDSNLSGSDLRGSNLSGSDLRGSDLSGSDLSPIRDDLFAVLSFAPAETPALIAALAAGKVNGSVYTDGECGCLIGTLAIASGVSPADEAGCQSVHGLNGSPGRPIEVFFRAIQKGHTPENSQFAKLAHQWASEWLGRMKAAFQPVATN